jgi:hypothetical protein
MDLDHAALVLDGEVGTEAVSALALRDADRAALDCMADGKVGGGGEEHGELSFGL